MCIPLSQTNYWLWTHQSTTENRNNSAGGDSQPAEREYDTVRTTIEMGISVVRPALKSCS
jgi:hypothetical protein